MCKNLFEVSSGVTQKVTFYIFIVWICHFKLRHCNFLQRAKDNESMTKNLLQLTAGQVGKWKGEGAAEDAAAAAESLLSISFVAGSASADWKVLCARDSGAIKGGLYLAHYICVCICC